MSKNSLLMLVIGFIAGVGLTWSYFNLASGNSKPAELQQVNSKQQAAPVVLQPKIAEVKTQSAAPERGASLAQEEGLPLTNTNKQPVDELPLEEQVSQLKQQLAEQKTLMKNARQQLRAPSDAQAALQAQFDEQIRNEEWAYQTEIALQDFLLTSDLSATPEVVSAECKATVCKFELAAPTDNDSFDHTQWRELNDKLLKQEFWLQFKRTTSTSIDTELTLLMATEL